MALNPLYTDALLDTSVEITLPEWNTIRGTADIWHRTPTATEVDLRMNVNGSVVAGEKTMVQSETMQTAVDKWVAMDRTSFTFEHVVDSAGTYNVSFGDAPAQEILVLEPLSGEYESYHTNGGRAGINAADNFTIVAGTDTDLWETVDQFAAIYKEGAASETCTVVTKIEHQEDTHDFAKCGIMIRNDIPSHSGEGALGYAIVVMAPLDYIMTWDHDGDGRVGTASGDQPAFVSPTEPSWLKLKRDGTTMTGFYSKDGSTWSKIAEAEFPNAAPTQDVGMFATSLNSSDTSTVEFSEFTVRNQ